MISNDDDFCATRAHYLLLALAQQLGLGAAYRSFRHAAECEDRADTLRSAAWQVLGRAIIVALSLPGQKSADAIGDIDGMFFGPAHPGGGAAAKSAELRARSAAAPDLKPHAARIATNLELLVDAGRKGGSVSSATVSMIAQSLSEELQALFRGVDQLLTADAGPRPQFGQ